MSEVVKPAATEGVFSGFQSPSRWNGRKRILAIDLGVNNLVTAVNNIGEQPFIIKGGVVKSWNQYYNKKKANLQSIYDRQDIKEGYQSRKLTQKRNRKIKNFILTVNPFYLTPKMGAPVKDPFVFQQAYFALQTGKQNLLEVRMQ